MAFETKEQVMEKILAMKKPICPHCDQEMSLWEVPPISFSDGLGWGTPFLFVCFNDECELYVQGWDSLEENFGHQASYRCMCYPGQDNFECMPVFSPMGGTGQVIDDQTLLAEEQLKENTKKGFNILAECFVSKDGPAVLHILMDPCQPARVRLKAAEMIGDIGELEAIEPIQNMKFGNELLQAAVEKAIGVIHGRHFTRECPFCAEIIKKRAKICKHCGKDVAGE